MLLAPLLLCYRLLPPSGCLSTMFLCTFLCKQLSKRGAAFTYFNFDSSRVKIWLYFVNSSSFKAAAKPLNKADTS